MVCADSTEILNHKDKWGKLVKFQQTPCVYKEPFNTKTHNKQTYYFTAAIFIKRPEIKSPPFIQHMLQQKHPSGQDVQQFMETEYSRCFSVWIFVSLQQLLRIDKRSSEEHTFCNLLFSLYTGIKP